MKKLFFSLVALATFTACEKAEVPVPVSKNPNLESIIDKVETGQPLSTNEESFVDEYEATTDQTASRRDSIWLPTLMGSGLTGYLLPEHLQVNTFGALGFYFPPENIKALITMKVTWVEDGRQKSKKVYKVIPKMLDEYDIWSLYLNTTFNVDYDTKIKVITKGINCKGVVTKREEWGPWVYDPGFTKYVNIMPKVLRTQKMQDFFFVK